MYEVLIEGKFSSAHYLRQYRGADEPVHGHNWRVQVQLLGETLVQPEQYLVDFVEAQKALEKILSRIDYRSINEVPPFDKLNPSAENIAKWIFDEFKMAHPSFPASKVTVWETEACAASFADSSRGK